jgi:hypothetical protein
MIHNAKDLSLDQKAVIESLPGRRVQENEAVGIRAIEPPVLSYGRRHELVEQLNNYFAEVDARRKLGSPEEVDEIIDEGMRSVRSGYRPHQ